MKLKKDGMGWDTMACQIDVEVVGDESQSNRRCLGEKNNTGKYNERKKEK